MRAISQTVNLKSKYGMFRDLLESILILKKCITPNSGKKYNQSKIRELQDEVWKNRKEAFSMMSKLVDEIESNEDLEKFNQHMSQVKADL